MKIRLMRIYTINYAQLVVNLESFIVLQKVHKNVIDDCPTSRQILSAIGTPTYKIAKFLAVILKGLTSNQYSVKDSFGFAKEILQQNSDCFMVSLDITSLFANIPLDETINICWNELFGKKHYVSNLDRASFNFCFNFSFNLCFNFCGLLRKSHFSLNFFINNKMV